jgi:hypothetical protein
VADVVSAAAAMIKAAPVASTTCFIAILHTQRRDSLQKRVN